MIRFLVLTAAALVSAIMTWSVRHYALSSGLLDKPNSRSSHAQPTPRGGGLAIVATTLVGTWLITARGGLEISAAAAICLGGLGVALVGYLDDRRGLSPLFRMMVHILATVSALWMLDWSHDLGAMFPLLHGSIAVAIIALAVVWSINLYNFMDGIDGLAASQATFVAAASALFALISSDHTIAALLLLSAGASLGFLFWNRPPAKIFMGDVGSGFLGFWLAALALLLDLENSVNIWTSVALSSVFVSDATTTLLRRAFRGQRWYEAHRSHAYQHLARRWKSLGKLTSLLWVLNCLIVFPLAAVSLAAPKVAPAIAVGTVTAFAVLAWFARAGLDEKVVATSADGQ
jgi:Fuc2NAc and GlcNAc transferase